ncbi:unnamed protein product, partial [Brenthis ino]
MPVTNNVIGSENLDSARVTKEMKSYGTLFAKIPQEFKHLVSNGILSPSVFPQDLDLGSGCTNQIAKLIIPLKASHEISESKLWDGTSFIHIPIIRQPFKEYKVLVAVAPKAVRIGSIDNKKPIVVYVVFPDDDVKDIKHFEMPEIYFVAKSNEALIKNKNADPIIVMGSNRTVTGIKSAKMMKIVKLKNKLTNLF